MAVDRSLGEAVAFDENDRGERQSGGDALKSIADPGDGGGVDGDSKSELLGFANGIATNGAGSEEFVASIDVDDPKTPEKDAIERNYGHVKHVCDERRSVVGAEVLISEEGIEGVDSPEEDVGFASPLPGDEETDGVSGYETPKEDLFDPFAAAPEENACAPRKKIPRKSLFPHGKVLPFDLSDDGSDLLRGGDSDDAVEDVKIADLLNTSLVEIVIHSQFEEGILTRPCSPDVLQTRAVDPACWIVDPCPGAPLRPPPVPREFDRSLCRRLDFSEL